MSTALQLKSAGSMGEWAIMREQADIFLRSGVLPPSIKNPMQALVIMEFGRELGVGPMIALTNINIIAGRLTVSPQLMLGLVKRTRELENINIVGDERACTVTMKRRGNDPHVETFTMADAARMKTTEGYGDNKRTISLSEKFNWKTMPAIMLRWRAVAAACRIVFPDATNGLYLHEEMGAVVDEEGVIAHTEQEAPAEVAAIPEDGQTVEDEADFIYPLTEMRAELLSKAKKRPGYKDEAFREWLITKFGLRLDLTLDAALELLTGEQLNIAIDALESKKEVKSG
jgi:RecT family